MATGKAIRYTMETQGRKGVPVWLRYSRKRSIVYLANQINNI